LKDTPSIDVMDSTFRRVHYVRYADDFLIGTISSKEYAKQLKQEIKMFLEEVLNYDSMMRKRKLPMPRMIKLTS